MAETVTAGCDRQLAQAEPSHAVCSAASALRPLALVTSSRSATASCHLASVPADSHRCAALMSLSTPHTASSRACFARGAQQKPCTAAVNAKSSNPVFDSDMADLARFMRRQQAGASAIAGKGASACLSRAWLRVHGRRCIVHGY